MYRLTRIAITSDDMVWYVDYVRGYRSILTQTRDVAKERAKSMETRRGEPENRWCLDWDGRGKDCPLPEQASLFRLTTSN